MKEEIEVLFNYKGTDVLIRRYKEEEFQVGVRGTIADIWLEAGVYNTVELAKSSGREYARIVIDKMIVSRKKGG